MKKLLLFVFIALIFGFFNLYYAVYTYGVHYPLAPVLVGIFYATLFGMIPSAILSFIKLLIRRENTLSSFLNTSIIFELIICVLVSSGMYYDLSNPF